ncbi:hypothetical protein ES705_26080 [subsurface metagenome]
MEIIFLFKIFQDNKKGTISELKSEDPKLIQSQLKKLGYLD